MSGSNGNNGNGAWTRRVLERMEDHMHGMNRFAHRMELFVTEMQKWRKEQEKRWERNDKRWDANHKVLTHILHEIQNLKKG